MENKILSGREVESETIVSGYVNAVRDIEKSDAGDNVLCMFADYDYYWPTSPSDISDSEFFTTIRRMVTAARLPILLIALLAGSLAVSFAEDAPAQESAPARLTGAGDAAPLPGLALSDWSLSGGNGGYGGSGGLGESLQDNIGAPGGSGQPGIWQGVAMGRGGAGGRDDGSGNGGQGAAGVNAGGGGGGGGGASFNGDADFHLQKAGGAGGAGSAGSAALPGGLYGSITVRGGLGGDAGSAGGGIGNNAGGGSGGGGGGGGGVTALASGSVTAKTIEVAGGAGNGGGLASQGGAGGLGGGERELGGNHATGGGGGGALLNATGQRVVTDTLRVTSEYGGGAGFSAGLLKASSIILSHKYGTNLIFDVDTLELRGGDTGTTMSVTSTVGADRNNRYHIGTLLLTGGENSAFHLTGDARDKVVVERLASNGGTLGNRNWDNLLNAKDNGVGYRSPDIELIGAGVNFNIDDDKTLAPVLFGSGGVTKNGAGTLRLTGENRYSGATDIVAGGLNVGGGWSGGRYDGAIRNNGVLTIDMDSRDLQLTGVISGTGSLVKNGSGTLTLAGMNTYDTALRPLRSTPNGETTVNGGTLRLTGTLGGGVYNGFFRLAQNTVFHFDSTSDLILNDGIFGVAGRIVKDNLGTLNFGAGLKDSELLAPQLIAQLDGIQVNAGTVAMGMNQTVETGPGGFTLGDGTTLRIAAGKLNAYAGSINTAALGDGLLTIGSNVTLDLAGFDGSGDVIVSEGRHRGYFSDVTIAGMRSQLVDFLTVGAVNYDDANKISVAGMQLTWDLDYNAHGNFTLDGDSVFTVGTVLADANGAEPLYDWDQKTLTKRGSGRLILLADNTFTGPLVIEGGAVQIGNGGASGSIATDSVQLNTAAATLYFNRGDDITYAGAISGAGGLSKNGRGVTTLSGANTYTGDTVINGGTLKITGTLGTDGDYHGAIRNGDTLDMAQSGTQTLSGNISGIGKLIHSGSGATILTGDNSYEGDTFINAGSLTGNIAPATNLTIAARALYDGAGQARLLSNLYGAGQLRNTAGLTVTGGDFAGAIDASNTTLTKVGTGTLTLSGANSYTGATTVTGGTLVIAADSNIGAGVNTLADATLSLSGNAYSKGWTLTGMAEISNEGATTLSGVLSGAGNLIKSGAGELTLTGDNSYGGDTVVVAGALTVSGTLGAGNYTGNISSDGRLTFRQDRAQTLSGVLSGGGSLTKAGVGVLTLAGSYQMAGDINIAAGTLCLQKEMGRGDFAGNIVNDGLLLLSQSSDQKLSGVIFGTGALSKSGAGTLTLTGVNSYAGSTNISAGTLAIASDRNIGAGANILTDATLRLSGVSYAKSWLLRGQAVIDTTDAVGAVTLRGALTDTGALNKTGAGTLILTGNNRYQGGTTVTAGVLKGNAAPGTLTIARDAIYDGGGAARNFTTLSGAGLIRNTATLTVEDGAFAGVLDESNSGGLRKIGEGTLTLTGDNRYSGGTYIAAGRLVGNIAPDSDLEIVAGATYDGARTRRTIAELRGAGVITGTTDLKVQSGDWYGVIDNGNTGGLTKVGPGTLTLYAPQSYLGGTSIAGGTLALAGAGMIGAGDLNFYDGGVLDITALDGDLSLRGRTVTLKTSGPDPRRPQGAHATIIATDKQMDLSGADLRFDMLADFSHTRSEDGLINVRGGQVQVSADTKVTLRALDKPKDLRDGDRITLIHADQPSGVVGADELHQREVTTAHGLIEYDFYLSEDVVNASNLYAVYGGSHPVNDADLFPDGAAGRSVALNDSVDHVLRVMDMWKYSAKGRFAPEPGLRAAGFSLFGSLQGADTRTQLDGHVDHTGYSLLGGGAWDHTGALGDLLAAVYFEGGSGSYEATGAAWRSGGDTSHWSGGMFAKQTLNNGLYFEASGRGGRVRGEYEGQESLAGVNYDSRHTWYGAHAGVGKEWRVSPKGIVDGYVKFIWTRQDSDSFKAAEDEIVAFQPADSLRGRLGGRYIRNETSGMRWYAGLSWEREFDGRARVTIDGMEIPFMPSQLGNSVILDAGATWTLGRRLTLDGGATVLFGQREGLTGNLALRYVF